MFTWLPVCVQIESFPWLVWISLFTVHHLQSSSHLLLSKVFIYCFVWKLFVFFVFVSQSRYVIFNSFKKKLNHLSLINVVICLGNCCRSCMTRIPYATMIATVMCLIGVAIFCTSMYRGASLMIIMFDRVFRFRLFWIEAVQMIFVTIGASMAGLGFMILFVGCLATGSTRYKVYRAWRSRVGGRISCAVVSLIFCSRFFSDLSFFSCNWSIFCFWYNQSKLCHTFFHLFGHYTDFDYVKKKYFKMTSFRTHWLLCNFASKILLLRSFFLLFLLF